MTRALDGGLGPPFPLTQQRVMHPSVEAMLAAWLQRNSCTTSASASEQDFSEWNGHTAHLLVYQPCLNGVEVSHWQLTVAGHGWPDTTSPWETALGPSTQVIDANRGIWRFFSRFSLSE